MRSFIDLLGIKKVKQWFCSYHHVATENVDGLYYDPFAFVEIQLKLILDFLDSNPKIRGRSKSRTDLNFYNYPTKPYYRR